MVSVPLTFVHLQSAWQSVKVHYQLRCELPPPESCHFGSEFHPSRYRRPPWTQVNSLRSAWTRPRKKIRWALCHQQEPDLLEQPVWQEKWTETHSWHQSAKMRTKMGNKNQYKCAFRVCVNTTVLLPKSYMQLLALPIIAANMTLGCVCVPVCVCVCGCVRVCVCVCVCVSLPAMQWHAHKRLFAFLSGNLAPLFLRLQYVLNVFIVRSFVKSLSMPIDSLLTTIFFLETKSLPSIPTKRYESEPDLPKSKLLLPNAGRSNRHCLSIEKTSNRQRRGKLTMSSRLAGWSPRLC